MFRRNFVVPLAVSFFALPGSNSLAAEAANISGCLDAVGTYMTSRSSVIDGNTRIDRGLIALTNGGHALVTDSAEGGVNGYQPFSSGSGAWRCLGNEAGENKIKIVTFDFTTTPDAETDRYIARVTVSATADPASNSISGNSLVEFLAIDAAPDTAEIVRPSVSYDFTGVKLEVSE
ncbi:hypothetical protein [uncultured Roseibium sp.]|uniref:hypothetical protein n=1 Tax=uncultured Roseibium sp. TaxID=1936171 RepID=UPI00261D633F|nr:hypothetical protein [uncultured Roseibium sp.]